MITGKGSFVYKQDLNNRRYRIYYIEDYKTNNEQTKLVADVPDIYEVNLAEQLCNILNKHNNTLNLNI